MNRARRIWRTGESTTQAEMVVMRSDHDGVERARGIAAAHQRDDVAEPRPQPCAMFGVADRRAGQVARVRSESEVDAARQPLEIDVRQRAGEPGPGHADHGYAHVVALWIVPPIPIEGVVDVVR